VSAIAIAAGLEVSSDLNEWMQLVPFPDEFRWKLVTVMVGDYACAWCVEVACAWCFSDNKPKKTLLLEDE
jgi:cation-transporting ATPase 13A1